MQTFESASVRLEEIVTQLSSEEDISLEKSLELYSQAAELIKFSNDVLNKAQLKIQEIDDFISSEAK